MTKNKNIRRLDLNFNVKRPGGTDYQEAYQETADAPIKYRTVPLSVVVANFLIAPDKHENLSRKRAWLFAEQLEESGIIETDEEGLNELKKDFDDCKISMIFHQNLEKAIIEAKKKSEQVSEEEVLSVSEGDNI